MKRLLMMCTVGAVLVAVPCQFARADIVFVVDSSRSICGSDSSCNNWRSILDFVNSVVNRLNVGMDNTRVGFVRYSSSSATSNEFYLNSNNFNRNQVTRAVRNVQYNTGGSFVGDVANALQVARTQQFVTNRGDRVGAQNIIVVLTNGGFSASSPGVSVEIYVSFTFLNRLLLFFSRCKLSCCMSTADWRCRKSIREIQISALTLWRPLLPYGHSYKAFFLCQTRLSRSFVIFDIRALWRSRLSVRVPGYQKLQMTT